MVSVLYRLGGSVCVARLKNIPRGLRFVFARESATERNELSFYTVVVVKSICIDVIMLRTVFYILR